MALFGKDFRLLIKGNIDLFFFFYLDKTCATHVLKTDL